MRQVSPRISRFWLERYSPSRSTPSGCWAADSELSSAELKAILLDRVRPQFDAIELPKATLLQHSNGSEVLNGDVGVERSHRLLAQELRERSSCNTSSPVLSSDPVPDEASAIGAPAANVSRHATVYDNGPLPSSGIADDLRAPVQHEGVALSWSEPRHAVSFRFTLMLEEDRQILFQHVPQHRLFTSTL